MTAKTKKEFRLFVVTNCMECPNCGNERTSGAGYALDYFCKAAGKKLIAGYVENASEEPKNNKFPNFCPLQTLRK